MIQNRFPESRSRRLKVCVHRGLGQRLNKQKTTCSAEFLTDVFFIQRISQRALRKRIRSRRNNRYTSGMYTT